MKIVGQFTQKLLDRMKQYINWEKVSISYDPLVIINIIKKTVLAQIEEKYTFTIVYNQELSIYGFQHYNMTSDQWYEKLNTKVDVRNAIIVTRQHNFLFKWTSQQEHSKEFYTLQYAKQEKFRAYTKERYLTLFFKELLRQVIN